MIKKNGFHNIGEGLNILFDGKEYRIPTSGDSQEYPIGGLLCEFCRLDPQELKETILSCNHLDMPCTKENFDIVFTNFSEKVKRSFPVVASSMIEAEFKSFSNAWFNAKNEDKKTELLLCGHISSKKSILRLADFVLEDTGISEYGGKTVLQMMLTCMHIFMVSFELVEKVLFILLETNDELTEVNDKIIGIISSICGSYVDTQNIEYRVLLTEKGLESLFTIKSIISLFVFEIAHFMNSHSKIVRCKNCGNYFVPKGRANAVYCTYPLRNNPEKTCRDVGAQVARANKEKTDIVTKEYRKLYMRYKMAISRHLDDEGLEDRFIRFKKEYQIQKRRADSGEITSEQILDWLKRYDGGKTK